MEQAFTIRSGKSVPTDVVFEAWTSRNLERMFSVLGVHTHPLDRHFLLLGIAEQTYKLRSDPTMAQECSRISEMHLAEFPKLATAVKEEMGGTLPRVPTFQNYATLLTEQGSFSKAFWVCELAIKYGLRDGTSSGFEGRIAKIRKKEASSKSKS